MIGAIFEVADENCLVRLDSLEAGVGFVEALARRDWRAGDLVEARVKVRLGTNVAESLRCRGDTIDITEENRKKRSTRCRIVFIDNSNCTRSSANVSMVGLNSRLMM